GEPETGRSARPEGMRRRRGDAGAQISYVSPFDSTLRPDQDRAARVVHPELRGSTARVHVLGLQDVARHDLGKDAQATQLDTIHVHDRLARARARDADAGRRAKPVWPQPTDHLVGTSELHALDVDGDEAIRVGARHRTSSPARATHKREHEHGQQTNPVRSHWITRRRKRDARASRGAGTSGTAACRNARRSQGSSVLSAARKTAGPAARTAVMTEPPIWKPGCAP